MNENDHLQRNTIKTRAIYLLFRFVSTVLNIFTGLVQIITKWHQSGNHRLNRWCDEWRRETHFNSWLMSQSQSHIKWNTIRIDKIREREIILGANVERQKEFKIQFSFLFLYFIFRFWWQQNDDKLSNQM